jgi:hypothetical protein
MVEEARESNVARSRIHDRVGSSEENSIHRAHTHTHSELPTLEITFLKQCQLLGITLHDKTNGGHATNYSQKKANFKL